MRAFLLYSMLILFNLSVSGQVNTDSIFDAAINNAQRENYDEAIEQAQQVLKYFPNRDDVRIFVANVYAWQGNYDEALKNIEKACQINQASEELYDAWLNILLWSEKYEKLIEVADLAEDNNYADTYNLVLKRCLAYKGMNQYDVGVNYIEQNNIYLDSAALNALYNQMLTLDKDKTASFFYSLDLFGNNTPEPQHLLYADYSFKLGDNTFIARLNYANRFDLNDFQIEVDYYHLLAHSAYLYANYGYGINRDLFPHHRMGLEYFFSFYTTFEASLGARYMSFGSNDVYIVTGHLGKYFDRIWLSVRPYYVFHKIQNTLSTALNFRYYGKKPLNYWGLQLLYGNSPDERYAISQLQENLTLENYRLKIERNMSMSQSFELKLAAAYAKEEYISGEYRDRFTFELLLKHKF
jgi:YaiO family outer membrane protein